MNLLKVGDRVRVDWNIMGEFYKDKVWTIEEVRDFGHYKLLEYCGLTTDPWFAESWLSLDENELILERLGEL